MKSPSFKKSIYTVKNISAKALLKTCVGRVVVWD
jgi:hypothetical protein